MFQCFEIGFSILELQLYSVLMSPGKPSVFGFHMDEFGLFGKLLYIQAALDSLHFSSNIFRLFVFRYVDGYDEISTMSSLHPSDSMSGTTWTCLQFTIGLCISWVFFLLTALQSRTCCPWVTSSQFFLVVLLMWSNNCALIYEDLDLFVM